MSTSGRESPAHFRSSSFSTTGIPPPSPSSYAQASPSRPGIPHSSSLPTITPSPDPPRPSLSRRSSGSSTYSVVPPSTPSKPSSHSQYNHPYLIQSSSSGALTRSNTSPAIPHTPNSYTGHRSSKSMGFIRTSASVDDLRSPEKNRPHPSTISEDGSPPSPLFNTPYTPPVHRRLQQRNSMSNLSDIARSGSSRDLNGLANGAGDGSPIKRSGSGRLDMSVWEWRMGTKIEMDVSRQLPPNPKLWNSHDLAHYISYLLSHGLNPDPTSSTKFKRLPPAVIQDITTWIVGKGLSGKSFMNGGEGSWASSAKPPPFLQMLLSMSRNLRRASLKNNIKGVETSVAGPSPIKPRTASNGHCKDTSVLYEGSQEDDDEGEGDELDEGNVKKLAHEFDARSTGSQSVAGSDYGDNNDDHLSRSRATSIGSLGGQQSHLVAERTLNFEKGERIGKDEVGARFGRVVDTPSLEGDQKFSDGILGSEGAAAGLSRTLQAALASGDVEDQGEMLPPVIGDAEEVAGTTVDTLGLGLVAALESVAAEQSDEDEQAQSPLSETFVTPPPAYISSFERGPEIQVANAGDISQDSSTPTIGSAVMPMSDLPGEDILQAREQNHAWLEDATHVSNMIHHHKAGARPYGALRRSSSGSSAGGPRLPTLKSIRANAPPGQDGSAFGDLENMSPGLEDDFRDTGRKATLRPIRKVTEVFKANPAGPGDRSGSATPLPVGRPVEADRVELLLRELESARSRIDDLERQMAEQKRAELGWLDKVGSWTQGFADPALIVGGLAAIGAISVLTSSVLLAARLTRNGIRR